MTRQEFSITGSGTPEQVARVVDAIRTVLAEEDETIQQEEEAAAEQEALNAVGAPPLSLREALDDYSKNLLRYAARSNDARYTELVEESNALNLRFADEIEALHSDLRITMNAVDAMTVYFQALENLYDK